MPGLRLGLSLLSPVGEDCAGSGADQVCGHVVARGAIKPEMNPGIAPLATVTSNDGGALVMRFPAMLRGGATQKVGKRTEISVEGFWERWSSIGDLVFVPKNVVFEAAGNQVVLANIIFPRAWDDTYGARFGLRYDTPKAWVKLPLQLRCGGQWESSATPANALDPGALDWEKAAVTLGFGLEVLPGLTIDAFYLRTLTARFSVTESQMRTTNIFHEDDLAKGNPGLETVSGNGDYTIEHQRFGLGLRYRLGS
jgi:long-subunit fatty acid transport protein